MDNTLRISGIVEESIVDGPGLRYAVFTQGCPHRCKGCHNPETHDTTGGSLMDVRDIFRQFKENPLLAGITFSGGEPFLQPSPLLRLAQMTKALGKTVVAYSGYTYEQLVAMAASGRKGADDLGRLLPLVDLLVDGPYVESLRDLELRFRGSSNQRLLDRDARAKLDALREKSLRVTPVTTSARVWNAGTCPLTGGTGHRAV